MKGESQLNKGRPESQEAKVTVGLNFKQLTKG